MLAAGLLAAFAATFALERYLVVERPMDRADAILVLAGGADHEERNREAARLYRAGVAPVILLSDDGVMGGWDNERGRNPYFAEKARWVLLSEGVPDREITIIPQVAGPRTFAAYHGTEREAALTVNHLANSRVKKLLLVTSDYHSRRALTIYETAFSSADHIPEVGIIFPKNEAGAFWPSGRRLPNVIRETGKLASFRLRQLF